MAQQPDLQSILATLAQYSQNASIETPSSAPNQQGDTQINAPSTAVQSNSIAATQNSNVEAIPADPRLRGRPQSRSATPSQAQAMQQPQVTSIIDPATITVWQDGLRCVTKIAAQNKMFEASIRRMIKDQRTHEMRWYQERQALKQMQVSRAYSAAKASSILRSLNQGATGPSVEPQSEEDKQAELARFDRKVYAAFRDMDAAMTAELKGLGVPFFGTKPELIVEDDQKAMNAVPSASYPKWSGLVTENEMLELKRKMVGHLEALYRD